MWIILRSEKEKNRKNKMIIVIIVNCLHERVSRRRQCWAARNEKKSSNAVPHITRHSSSHPHMCIYTYARVIYAHIYTYIHTEHTVNAVPCKCIIRTYTSAWLKEKLTPEIMHSIHPSRGGRGRVCLSWIIKTRKSATKRTASRLSSSNVYRRDGCRRCRDRRRRRRLTTTTTCFCTGFPSKYPVFSYLYTEALTGWATKTHRVSR